MRRARTARPRPARPGNRSACPRAIATDRSAPARAFVGEAARPRHWPPVGELPPAISPRRSSGRVRSARPWASRNAGSTSTGGRASVRFTPRIAHAERLRVDRAGQFPPGRHGRRRFCRSGAGRRSLGRPALAPGSPSVARVKSRLDLTRPEQEGDRVVHPIFARHPGPGRCLRSPVRNSPLAWLVPWVRLARSDRIRAGGPRRAGGLVRRSTPTGQPQCDPGPQGFGQDSPESSNDHHLARPDRHPRPLASQASASSPTRTDTPGPKVSWSASDRCRHLLAGRRRLLAEQGLGWPLGQQAKQGGA